MKKKHTDIFPGAPSDSTHERNLPRGTLWRPVLTVLVVLVGLASVLYISLSNLQREPELGVILSTRFPPATPDPVQLIRPFPDATDGIHVFSDQLDTSGMTERQFEFAATHYTSAQKIFPSDARRLHAHNPRFVILNYRLGLGLGYRKTVGDCDPSGDWYEVIEGEKWVREFPEDPQLGWFFEWAGRRVLFCDWGWYIMDLGNASWRDYWYGEVLRQIRANSADGVFADGLVVPNYFGWKRFDPPLPELDADFEKAWSKRIEDFIAYAQTGELADYYFIPNVGEWVTGRDATDYSGADGVMVEGFGRWSDGSYFSALDEDWQLQMDRILGLVNLDKIILLQQYVDAANVEDRLFLIGSYLLVKGRHTYINLEWSMLPEWFPEYEIPIGSPVGGVSTISELWRSDWGIYAREYSNGLVLVNPTDEIRLVELPTTYHQAFPQSGGTVPADGDVSAWGVEYKLVTTVAVGPNQATVLVFETP
jgi:hypothetical protein